MNDIPKDRGNADRANEPRLQRAGCGYTYYSIQRTGHYIEGGVSSTLSARDYKSATDLIVAATQQGGAEIMDNGKCPTITAAAGMSGNNQPYMCAKSKPPRKYIVRRLTPLECSRLQGFPDWWTDGVEGSDSARYKMWGNGIALPCAVDVLRRIAKEVEHGAAQTCAQ